MMIWGRIFSREGPSYERAVSDLDRSMNISLWVSMGHSSFTEGLHTIKNTASEHSSESIWQTPNSTHSNITKRISARRLFEQPVSFLFLDTCSCLCFIVWPHILISEGKKAATVSWNCYFCNKNSKKMALMEQRAFKNVNNFLNTNIYSHLETSGNQSFNIYLIVDHFFNTSVN
jgi:hypothetical protein